MRLLDGKVREKFSVFSFRLSKFQIAKKVNYVTEEINSYLMIFVAIFWKKTIFAKFITMNKRNLIVKCLAVAAVLLACVACHKSQMDAPIVGHWGCEDFVKCTTDEVTGAITWDTTHYEVGEGVGIEVFFNSDGTGRLLLNESPAMITDFNCKYSYNEAQQQVVVEAPALLYILSQSFLSLSENKAVFDIEEINDTAFVASWTDKVADDTPAFERFYLKRID